MEKDIINIELGWPFFQISVNIFAILLIAVIILILFILVKHFRKSNKRKSLYVTEVDFEVGVGIGKQNIKLVYDDKDKQIAYQLWVEICTRKIGVEWNDDTDIVIELFNSWHDFFGIARNLIKDIPVRSYMNISNEENIVDLSIKMLNNVLRPTLTKWHAGFIKWYNTQINTDDRIPQEIQRSYKDYDQMIKEIKDLYHSMSYYINALYKIAFGKDEKFEKDKK